MTEDEMVVCLFTHDAAFAVRINPVQAVLHAEGNVEFLDVRILMVPFVFLELSCFFNDPTDVGNLISGSSAFSKSSLNIWKFSVHILLKPSLKDFEPCEHVK